VLAGKGNNGATDWSLRASAKRENRAVVLTAPEDQLGELPRAQLAQLRGAFPNLEIELWRDDLAFPGSEGVVIDALLGIQARGALRESWRRSSRN